MAKTDMSIAEQLKRAAEALELIDSRKKTTSPATSQSKSPAPTGSLSAALQRTDGLLRTGNN